VVVTLGPRCEMVVRVFLPPPEVRVIVVLPTFDRVVIRVPLFVLRIVIRPMLTTPLLMGETVRIEV